MRLPGTNWLWFATAMIVGIGVYLMPGQARAEEPYGYFDDFDDARTNFAETHSYLHSVFWPQGAFPPPEPYLYYVDTESGGRELGFGDRHGEPAFLGYRFPTGSAQPRKAVSGTLKIDVRFPYDSSVTSSRSGSLRYLVSGDGIEWSAWAELKPGSNEIPIASIRGTCHIVFVGSEVLIDNIQVELPPQTATIYVPEDHATIQAAIDSASYGDVIEVAAGTYSGPGNRDIRFNGKAITVRSAAGPRHTIIDCSGQRGFYFRGQEGSDSVLRGFTITGGRTTGTVIPPETDNWSIGPTHPIGAGIFCEFSSPTIINCIIQDCSAELGGGIGVVGGQPTIYDCVIEQCQTRGTGSGQSRGYGAGIGLIRGAEVKIFNCKINNNNAYSRSLGAGLYCRQSTAWLVGCDISYNSAQASVSGGGIYCSGTDAGISLEKCLISNNTAEVGAGVFAEQFDYAHLINCTIVDNKLSGGTASSAGGVQTDNGDTLIRNSIVWYNQGDAVSISDSTSPNPVLFSDIEEHYPGQGNIDMKPSFASRTNGDYHLKSLTGRFDPGMGEWVVDSFNDHSPCIDAGDPQDPIGPEPFPNSGRINMGAYGGTTEASRSKGPLTFHVDKAGGSDYNEGLSRRDAFRTIQKAVDMTLDGDTVMVWPGVYNEEVSLHSRAITIQSADDAAVVTAPNSYAFSFYTAESSRSVLRNFVIINCGKAAIYSESASPTLTNLTVTDNQFGMEAYGGANPIITSCIFWNNTDGDLLQCRARFSCLQELRGLDAENGNISTDPFFADPARGDYHLQSRYGRYSVIDKAWITDALTSPCIDAGDPDVYPGRERTPHGGRVNMGAYGGTPAASLSGWQSWDDVGAGVQFNSTN